MKQRLLQLLLTFKHKHFFSIDDFISNSADTRIYSELFPITKGLILNNSDKKKRLSSQVLPRVQIKQL